MPPSGLGGHAFQGTTSITESLNWPAFTLVPPAGRGTLDLGCGEGRAGRQLAAEGHEMAGIDSSSTLVELAREAGGYEQLICGDAAALPWDAQAFDLVVAFMSLHDMDDLARAIDEVARVLEPGERFCLAIVHPLNRPPEVLTGGRHLLRGAGSRRGLRCRAAATAWACGSRACAA